ncbi:MAG: hypothetical protein IJA52_03250 [Clostridia bacterium]|nr:hypothetical protein [Clostridia bacterium]
MRKFEDKNDYKKVRRLSPGHTALIAVNFVWMIALYYVCIAVSERTGSLLAYQICTGVYAVTAIFLGALSCVFTGKIVSEKTGEERTEKQKNTGKVLLLFVLPIIAVLLIDFIDLFVVEYIKRLLFAAK